MMCSPLPPRRSPPAWPPKMDKAISELVFESEPTSNTLDRKCMSINRTQIATHGMLTSSTFLTPSLTGEVEIDL